VFENRVLRRMLGPKGFEVTGQWRNLHVGEFHNLYLFPSIRQIESRRMWWVVHMACMGEERKVYKFGGKVRRKEATRKTEA
jgi:hypothetical protein